MTKSKGDDFLRTSSPRSLRPDARTRIVCLQEQRQLRLALDQQETAQGQVASAQQLYDMSIEDLRKAKEGGNEEKVREAKQEVREAEEEVEKAKKEVREAKKEVREAEQELREAEEKVKEAEKVEVKKAKQAKQAKHRSFALQMTVETTDQNGRIQNVTTGDETMSREDSLRSFS